MQGAAIVSLRKFCSKALGFGPSIVALNENPGMNFALPVVDIGEAHFHQIDGCRLAGADSGGGFVDGSR